MINTAVATIADDLSLSTSTLGWALDVYMVATLDEHLDRAGAGQVEKAKLDRVLTGSPSVLKSTAKELDPNTRKAFVSGARRGIVGGFSDVMWLIAAVGIAGTVVGFWLLGPDRQRPRP